MVNPKKWLRDVFVGYWKSLVATALFWTVVTSYGSWAPVLDTATGGGFALAVEAWKALAFGQWSWVAAVLFYVAGFFFWYLITRSWHGSAYRFLLTFLPAAGSYGILSSGGVAVLSLLWVLGMFSVIWGYFIKAAMAVTSVFDHLFHFFQDGKTVMSRLPRRLRKWLEDKGVVV